MKRNFWKPFVGLVAALSLSAPNASIAQEAVGSLDIYNNSDQGMMLEINRDGGQYWLSIPDAKVSAHSAGTYTWFENSGPDCTPQVRALYDDGTESAPVTINICEHGEVKFGN